jgi:hypothetical protein
MRPLFLVLLVAGCGSAEDNTTPSSTDSDVVATDTGTSGTTDTGGTPTTDSNVAVDSEPPADVAADTPAPPTYPAGPYGTMVGNVVANLELEGYTRYAPTTGLATTATYGATSFATLRSTSPKKYALVHVSGFT